MKLIHKTPLGKYSANATGVGERRKSTAQKRHLVNNIVSSIGKKKKTTKTQEKSSSKFFFSKIPFYFAISSVPWWRAPANSHPSVCCISVLPSPCHSGTFQAWHQPVQVPLWGFCPWWWFSCSPGHEFHQRNLFAKGPLEGFSQSCVYYWVLLMAILAFLNCLQSQGILTPKDLLIKQHFPCVGWDPDSEPTYAQIWVYI